MLPTVCRPFVRKLHRWAVFSRPVLAQMRALRRSTHLKHHSLLSPPATFQSLIGHVGEMDITEFRKTYVLANFYCISLDITLIAETQAVLVTDVINGVGGALSLSLGGSFLVLGEIVFNGLLPLMVYICRLRKRVDNNVFPG